MSSSRNFIFLGWIATLCAIASATATAATYKCKDADGSWTEAACQTKADAPPASDSAASDPGATASGPTSEQVEQDNRKYTEKFNACVSSLMGDSGFDSSGANSACRLRSSKEFYLCVYHLTTFDIERINAVHACSTNPSMEVVNCIFKGTRDSTANKGAVISSCTR